MGSSCEKSPPDIETPDFPASEYPYAFTTEDAAAEKGDAEKIATTYGTETRWEQYQQQAMRA